MDDARKLSHSTMPPGGQVVLIMDDDPLVTGGLAAGLERKGRHVVTCNDLESAQLALEWVVPTHGFLRNATAPRSDASICSASGASPVMRIVRLPGRCCLA